MRVDLDRVEEESGGAVAAAAAPLPLAPAAPTSPWRADATLLVTSYNDFDCLAHLPRGKPSAAGLGGALHRLSVDARSGELRQQPFERVDSCPPLERAASVNPAFVHHAPERAEIFVATECIDREGRIVVLDAHSLAVKRSGAARGRSTCYLRRPAFDRRLLLAVNYWDATVALLDAATLAELHVLRRPGFAYCAAHAPDRDEHLRFRQRWSHTHCAVDAPPLPGGVAWRFVFVPDLGEDEILQLRLEVLEENDRGGVSAARMHVVDSLRLAAGHGPRHIVFHPSGRAAFVSNELDSTVDVLRWDGARLSVAQTVSTVPPGLSAKSHCAEVCVRPDGRFVYVTNRFSDSIAVFDVVSSSEGVALQLVAIQSSMGCTPRHMAFVNNELCAVANTDDNSLVVFRVQRDSGVLLCTGRRYAVDSPNYIQVLPPPPPPPPIAP